MKEYLIVITTFLAFNLTEFISYLTVWMWIEKDRSHLLLIPGVIFIALSIYVTFIAGTKYDWKFLTAIFCPTYIVTSIFWSSIAEQNPINKFDF